MDPVFVPLAVAVVAFALVSSFNDGGNLVASFVAARAFSLVGGSALLLVGAAAGPWLVGGAVARTFAFAIVALPRLGPGVCLAAVTGAVLTLLLSWWRGLPTSTSLALVGGLAGAGLVRAGPKAVHWTGVAVVLGGMVVALALGAVSGWAVWSGVRLGLRYAGEQAAVTMRRLQAATGLLQGLAYGGNSLERTIGLLALLAAWQSRAGQRALAAGHLPVPAWTVWASVLLFGSGMVLGGLRIARTLGFRLFPVRAADALSAQLAASLTVLAAARAGIPVSSTQTATAALVAAGAARRLSQPRWRVVQEMARAWAVTLPLALILGGALAALAR
jgi:PiT family inorganic phosphate transporter